jgi:hypothetical protein
MPAELDPDVRATLETAALLMREGYVVKNPRHYYEDENGEPIYSPISGQTFACGCFLGNLHVAASWYGVPQSAVEDVLEPLIPSDSADPFYGDDPFTSLLAQEGPAGCIAVIERALAGANS